MTLVRALIRSLVLAGDCLFCRGIVPLPHLWWAQFSVRRSAHCSYRFGWVGTPHHTLASLRGLMGLLMLLMMLLLCMLLPRPQASH